jgi:hypothetical protein
MPSQSLARIMYGTSREYSVAANPPLAPFANLSHRAGSRFVRELEAISELLHKVWASLSGKY